MEADPEGAFLAVGVGAQPVKVVEVVIRQVEALLTVHGDTLEVLVGDVGAGWAGCARTVRWR